MNDKRFYKSIKYGSLNSSLNIKKSWSNLKWNILKLILLAQKCLQRQNFPDQIYYLSECIKNVFPAWILAVLRAAFQLLLCLAKTSSYQLIICFWFL